MPMVLALNMMDEVRANGGTVDVNALETSCWASPWCPSPPPKNEGIDELVDHAMHVGPVPGDARAPRTSAPARRRLRRCPPLHPRADAPRSPTTPSAPASPHGSAATKLVEGDPLVLEAAAPSTRTRRTPLEHIVRPDGGQSRGLDRAAALADMRFSFIEGMCADARGPVPQKAASTGAQHAIDQRRSRAATRRIPAFLCIMALVFWLTFDVVGAAAFRPARRRDRLRSPYLVTGDALAALAGEPGACSRWWSTACLAASGQRAWPSCPSS